MLLIVIITPRTAATIPNAGKESPRLANTSPPAAQLPLYISISLSLFQKKCLENLKHHQ
jgi:hypothetical protein